MKIKNLDNLQRILLDNLDNYSIFSFDLFDTVLGRRIEPPTLIHRTVAERIAQELDGEISVDYILGVRAEVEKDLRNRAFSRGLDFECNYEEIVQNMVERIWGDNNAQVVDWISDLELEIENKCLFVKKGMLELLRKLYEARKTVIIASDMYLTRRHINSLLEKKGISPYIYATFVSNENFRCKYSGKLFLDIVDFFQTDRQQIIHCGDNQVSDYQVPRSLGIRSVYLSEKEDWKRREILKKYYFLSCHSNFWKGRYLMHVIENSLSGSVQKQGEFFYRYGYEVLGFIFCTYMLGVIEQVKKNKLKRLYFLARDGFLLQRLFYYFASEFDSTLQDITTQYVFLSRQSTALAVLANGMDHFHALLPLYNPKQRGIESILNAYNLPNRDFYRLAAKHGFPESDQPIYDWNDPRLHSFIEDEEVQDLVKGIALEYKQILSDYLEQIGFFQQDQVALVDIGWNATIQYFLSNTYQEEARYPDIYGLYFGFCQGIPYRFTEKDHIYGIFYDERRNLEVERVVLSFEELFEESCRAMHSTTVGYYRKGQKVMPELKDGQKKDRIAEKANNAMIRQIQRGILDFAKEFIQAIQITGLGFGDLKPFASSLAERAVVYPKKEEVVKIRDLVHTEDWGYDNILQFDDNNWSFRPLSWKRQFLESNWKYGFAASTLGRLSLPILRYLHIVRAG